MPTYDSIINRSNMPDSLIPVQEVSEIIKMMPESSVMLANARRATLSSKQYKQPVLTTLPDAYWVNGDTGLKQTTSADWDDMTITAEELAVIVPIPDALVSDAKVNLWDEIRPLLAEAIGKKVDQAAIFGVDKPASWPASIKSAAIAAGNYVVSGTGRDFGVDVANMAKKVAEQGYAVNGFMSKPGIQWQLIGLRDTNGQPIYTPLADRPENGLYGYALNEVMNGSWDANEADLIGVDWSKQIIGIRQDVTYRVFKEGVISDGDGKVILNLMQQDTSALRVVFRVGYQVAKPKTRVQGATAYPGGIIVPAGASGITGLTGVTGA